MSFYTDFIVAAEVDAPEIATAGIPTEQWSGLSVKSISETDLANAWSLVWGEPDVGALHGRFDLLCCEEESGRTVSKLPRCKLERIADLTDSELPKPAASWAHAEEFAGRWKPSQLEDLLRGLRGPGERLSRS
jgi:hypothetical protein